MLLILVIQFSGLFHKDRWSLFKSRMSMFGESYICNQTLLTVVAAVTFTMTTSHGGYWNKTNCGPTLQTSQAFFVKPAQGPMDSIRGLGSSNAIYHKDYQSCSF